MSDMAYIMETQDPRELWLVDGENKFKVSRDMYWLLVSQGAELPLVHDISELLAENAKLREAVATAIKVQVELCGNADRPYCSNECQLYRQESDDCLACDVIVVAQELGIEVA